ncbi:MAG: ABC transporter permease subunit [Acidobacteriota bacterium]|nr:ABC transporter permease subunit [Acidobacteriota bacterium]
MAAVGALFPAVGHTIGALHVPRSVANLLGGADYGTVTGWFRSEIGAIYGPLLVGALAITGAAAAIAGEEEDRILDLILAYPVRRSSLVLADACADACIVLVLAACTWIGLLVGVAVAGGGVALGHMIALAVQLAFFGFAVGAVSVCVAAATGRRSLAAGAASAIAVLGWLINSFAPLVGGLSWLKYLSLYYYYAGHDPLTRGIGLPGLAVLAAVAAVLVGVGMVAIGRRDLRG